MKKVPGSIYMYKDPFVGKEETYVAIYSYYPDVSRVAPPSLQNAERVAHVEYYCSGRFQFGGIDIFYCELVDPKLSEEVEIKRTIKSSTPTVLESFDKEKEIDHDYNINAQVLGQHESILYHARADILQFARFHKLGNAKNPGDTEIDIRNNIVVKTKVRKSVPTQYLRSGKQDFVPFCALESNLDFSRGCPSSFIPIDTYSSFFGDSFVGFYSDVNASCGYCYAEWKNKCFPKFMIEIDKKKLLEELVTGKFEQANGDKRNKKVGVLRLGKSTEAGSLYTLDELVKTLEVCVESGTQVVMPTKYLRFDKDIADLLRRTKSSVLFSLGYDELERGACVHGCTNEHRLEQAKLFRKSGVNSILYLLIDLPSKPTEDNLKILDFSKQNKIPVQLLPVRLYDKETAKRFTGKEWNHLRRKYKNINQFFFNGMVDKGMETYFWEGNHLLPIIQHKFWGNLIEDNNGFIRMCHHDSVNTYCGSCFLEGRKGFIERTRSVKVNYRKKRWKVKKKKPVEEGHTLFDGK